MRLHLGFRFRSVVWIAVLLFAGITCATEDLIVGLQNGRDSGRPLLVLIQDPTRIATLDAAYWLKDLSSIPGFPCDVLVGWADRLDAGSFTELKAGGLFLLDAHRQLVARIPIPPLREQLKGAVQEALSDPTPLEALASRAEAGTAGNATALRAWQRLVDAGQVERAARLLGQPAHADLAKTIQADADLPLRERLWALRAALQSGEADAGTRIMRELLDQRMDMLPRLHSLDLLSHAVVRWGHPDDARNLKKILEREALAGRPVALAALQVGDAQFERGDVGGAFDWWKLAERAADRGESPVLYRAIVRRRAAADGKDAPVRSRWYKREVLDVVVLVDDLPSFAKAVSGWSDKTFYPVLFRDRVYAPRFLNTFRPSCIIILPPASGSGTLHEPELRRALLASWHRDEDEARLPVPVGRAELLERLRAFGDDPQGLVFTHEDSEELAGALALAAGRFQGLEFLETGMHAQQAVLAPMAVRELARFVETGLDRWGLPRDGRSCAVTLGGGFPVRYEVQVNGRTRTLAVDDWIGRAWDGGRLALTGRLFGGREASAYEAACSLFLKPDDWAATCVLDAAASADMESLCARMVRTGVCWYAAGTSDVGAEAWRSERERNAWLRNASSWSQAFRRDDGQAFGWPGPGMILGDPLLSLRKADAKRRSLERGLLVAPGEVVVRVSGTPDFTSKEWLEKMTAR